MTQAALVHYHELALKGKNRPIFERRLVRNIRSVLEDLPGLRVAALPGRIRIDLADDADWSLIAERLRRVPGVANFSHAYAVPIPSCAPDLEPLQEAIGRRVSGLPFHTFRVTTKRADKRFPLTSPEINRAVGAHVCRLTGRRVSLGNPELTIYIEVLEGLAYYAVQRESGPGGLPVGMSGRVMCLLSGGIDSPVAAYRMMKRGCRAVFVHFHGRPYVSRASEEKARELADLLTRYQLYSRLYLIPFGDLQRRIVLASPPPYRVVLYRRLMVRIAQEFALAERCWALVTGDSLGQVASQTPENLSIVTEASRLPLLRPLIGMDKIEITEQAQAIGTFETSIEPDQDCCRLFVPPNPSIRTRPVDIAQLEARMDLDAMVAEGLKAAELVEFTFPPRRELRLSSRRNPETSHTTEGP